MMLSIFLFTGCFPIKLYSHFKIDNQGTSQVENLKISVVGAKSDELLFVNIPGNSQTGYTEYYLYDYSPLCIFTASSFSVEYSCESIVYSKTFENVTVSSNSFTKITINGDYCEQDTYYGNNG